MDLTAEEFAQEVEGARQRVRGSLKMTPPPTESEALAWYKYLAKNALGELEQLAEIGKQFARLPH